jgi:hypothetical protein
MKNDGGVGSVGSFTSFRMTSAPSGVRGEKISSLFFQKRRRCSEDLRIMNHVGCVGSIGSKG